eukprot:CAMPEP_0184678416 /NCGR_PEP_ID=MMETSP0312-20130426/1155_1 /TAXON_ID=31354 /ORGANISM="Compsopogon coeruleus, Strain SAG 36.94" /LENGTH=341 /DNA_ID=CAMNT_0027127137 /DNA_START=96 /DNA_END=1121 /DNA_ORIENTATION=+
MASSLPIAETLPGNLYAGPNVYGPNLNNPYEVDYAVASLVSFFAAFVVSLLLVLDFRSLRKVLHGFASLFLAGVFCIILLGIYTRDWHSAEVETVTAYAPFDRREVHAKVGLHVGLAGINVTLKGVPEEQIGQVINYNEEFDWATPDRSSFFQGRIGFGRYSNLLNRAFRQGQFTGLPLPIQWVVEYFTFDGDGIRWGRYYRLAGYYTFLLMWLAMGFFILTLLFGVFRLKLGVLFLWCCGVTMISACVLYTILINAMSIPLAVPFVNESGESLLLQPSYGWSYFLVLITGIVVTTSSIVLGLIASAAEVARKISDGEIDTARGFERVIQRCVPLTLSNSL